MKAFKNISVDVGEIKAGSKGTEVFWEFQDLTRDLIAQYTKGKDIVYLVRPKCGCTADLEILDNGIKASYNDSGNMLGDVIKRVSVYLKPKENIPVQVKNKRGVLIPNPKLGKVTLSFTANIVT